VTLVMQHARRSARAGAAVAALAGHCLLGAGLLVGCAPATSTTPLGMGPLAIAEQAAEQNAARKPKPAQPSKASARSEPDAPVAPVSESVAAKDEEPDLEVSAAGDDQAPPESGSPSPAFEGMFAGTDVAVFRLTGFPEREQRDEKAKIRIEKSSTGVSITLINSEDGSDLCALEARVEGKAALIESAQPCFSDGGEGSVEAMLTSGRAVLNGDQLRMNAEGTLSMALPDQELEGELVYTFEGKRE